MKKAKILLALLLTALFVLSALGSGESSSSSDVPVEDDYVVDTYEPEAEEPVEEAKEISRGVISGNTYYNDFAGFNFTKLSDWRFYTDEELAESFNASQAELDLNLLEEALLNNVLVYDMAAVDESGNSVMVYYENTKVTSLTTVTLDEYVDELNDIMEEDDPDITYTHVSTEDVMLGTTTYKKLLYSASMDGFSMDQAYYVRLVDQYAVVVIITGGFTKTLPEMEAMFS